MRKLALITSLLIVLADNSVIALDKTTAQFTGWMYGEKLCNSLKLNPKTKAEAFDIADTLLTNNKQKETVRIYSAPPTSQWEEDVHEIFFKSVIYWVTDHCPSFNDLP